MFSAQIRLRQLLRATCYALLFSVILMIVLSSRNQPTKCTPSKTQTSNSDWNFYESIGDDDIREEVAKEEEDCALIHVATVCGGYHSTREFYILLKSILFYRTNPVRLHLLVDDVSHKILNELFRTWQVPDLEVKYYNSSEYEQDILWIPTHHYSSQFGLLKLIFPSLIYRQSSISKVILLDTDMLMLGNVNDIWRQFDEMKRKNAPIGLVENQSDWYLGKQKGGLVQDRLVWPAIGRGFNTGLVLFDLDKLKSVDWDQLWREVAEIELVTRLSTALADQDIFNAVSKVHPHLFYKLPFAYNIQLNEHANSNRTLRQAGSHFQLIHWNSPNKLETSNKLADHYRSWYATFLNWDSSLLKRNVCTEGKGQRRDQSEAFERSSLEEGCKEIRPRPEEKLRTYLYFTDVDSNFKEQPEGEAIDVTLVVHLSVDRLRALDELAAHWPGPASVAIYLAEFETSLLMESIKDAENLSKRKNIGYHLVFRDHGFNYPINRLRNTALNEARTTHVFLADVDFLPSYNLYEYLKASLEEATQSLRGTGLLAKQALVVPAFESSQYKFEFPLSKSDLERQLNIGSVSMFRAQIWPRGHAPTDYARWRQSTRPYYVRWQADYEPFIVTTRDVVRFDERFVGFGWNKVEHTMQLAAMGYEFQVLPEAFVIHQFHPASYDIVKHRESQKYRACIRQLKAVFTTELVNKYPALLAKLRSIN